MNNGGPRCNVVEHRQRRVLHFCVRQCGEPFFRWGLPDMHELRTSLVLPISLDEAWAFFSVPDNLDDITPPDMGLKS